MMGFNNSGMQQGQYNSNLQMQQGQGNNMQQQQ
jgi:hypothetical protein